MYLNQFPIIATIFFFQKASICMWLLLYNMLAHEIYFVLNFVTFFEIWFTLV